ncbi:MAG: hypothetical protein JNK37_05300 [Verrucomicrobiales bacterium]|nr:hypothetical protein [Verrucomicrobiales bacterium]
MKTPPSSDSADASPGGVRLTPKAERLRQCLAANDARIRSTDLDIGEAIVRERTAIYTAAIADWAAEQQAAFGYDRPFAVAALGGTGRQEVTPCSDRDIAILFEDDVESPGTLPFVRELKRQTEESDDFRRRHGFTIAPQPRGRADLADLREKDLNSFLDILPIYDPGGLAESFRQTIRETYDPFEHFLHVRSLWRRLWERAGAMAEAVREVDLKNDVLRLFLSGVWTLGGKDFEHSHAVYARIAADDPRILDAYHFLLRLRCWIQLSRTTRGPATALGNHPEDVMRYEDFERLGDWLGTDAPERDRLEFGNAVRARILDARRRIAMFARGVIEGELRPGRRISPGHPVALGAGGLYHAEPETCVTDGDHSRAALRLLLMAQRYELPVDPSELQTTFQHAGDWLVPVPELAALFLEPRGSLATTFDFLSRIPGAEDRLFPGYGQFESSLDERVMTEQLTLRGPLEREKMRALEADRREGQRLLAEDPRPERYTDVAYAIRVEVEAALLTDEQLAAVKLAIKTKRLPVTADDLAARDDPARSLVDRFSSGFSGIPIADYYPQSFAAADFPAPVLDLARFLVENRRTFREIVDAGLIDDAAVTELLQRCGGDRDRLRALYVFTHADRHAWKSPTRHPARFFNIRELYAKARMPAERRYDPDALLQDAGYADAESQTILKDFGEDFYKGIYRHYAVRFGGYLLKLNREGRSAKPRVTTIAEGPARLLGVAALDDRGLAASITGALWKRGVRLQQAHLFCATNHRLALDFFHLAPKIGPDGEPTYPCGPDLSEAVAQAITDRLHIDPADETDLPGNRRDLTLTEWRPGLCRLRAESDGEVGALLYGLCLKATLRLRADIHGLTAHAGRLGARVSLYLSLPKGLSLDAARAVLEEWQ